MSYASRTLVLLNPAAGRVRGGGFRRRLAAAFDARGAAIDIVETERAVHATELARLGTGRGYRAVCAVGGDGTIAEAAHGMVGSGVPLAIIPRGTANQLARNLLVPEDLESAVDVAVSGRAVPFDLGTVDGRTFALVAGAGFDAAVMEGATRALKRRWGFGAYVLAAMRKAMVAAPTVFTVTADDREIRIRAVSVLLANVGELFPAFSPVAFSLTPQPTRSWQDGVLDVLIVAPRGLTGIAAAAWKSARRQFAGDDHLIHLQARRVGIASVPPTRVQIDGDAIGSTPFVAEVVPAGLRVLVPSAVDCPERPRFSA